jgi:hypothetical protein
MSLGVRTTYEYSIHPKAGLSGIRMAISRTLFGSGFQMVTSLDSFVKKRVMNKKNYAETV